MRHELDGEDISMVASIDTRIEREGFRLAIWVVIPDVQVSVVRARGEKSTARRPTVDSSALCSCLREDIATLEH